MKYEDEQVQLEWIRYNNRTPVPRGVFVEESLIEDTVNYIYSTMYADLNAFILGKKLPPEVKMVDVHFYAEYPKTTWQMFKETHKNSWWFRDFVKRFPVKMNQITEHKRAAVTWDRTLLFPDQNIVEWSGKLGSHVITLSEPTVKWEEVI